MRGNKIMGVLWLIIAVFLTFILFAKMKSSNSWKNSGLMITFNGKSGEDGKSGNSENLYDTLTFSVSEVNDIDIDLISESVYVEAADDNKITVELYCTEETAPAVQIIQNVLKIEDKKNKAINLSFGKRKVVVKVPKTFELNEIEISTSSGSIHGEALTASNMDCHSASGSVYFNQCKTDSMDIKSSSGSVHLSNCEIDDLECSTQSGSIHMSGIIDKAEVRAISGSIHAELSEPLKLNSEFQATSGSIKLNIPNNTNMNIKYSVGSGTYKNDISGTTGKKGTDTIGNGGPNVELRTTSGSIKVQ